MTTQANTTSIPYLDVNDGQHIPQLGFGVFQVPPRDTADVVRHALRTGQLDSGDGRIGPGPSTFG
jgi:2,5-diketo-D-gluconate reductase A